MAGIDEYTKLLIQSDTTDGSTTFVDSSLYGHTLTRNHDSAPKHSRDITCPLGLASVIKCSGSLTATYLSAAFSDEYIFGTNPCVLEMFIYTGNTANNMEVFRSGPTNSGMSFYTGGAVTEVDEGVYCRDAYVSTYAGGSTKLATKYGEGFVYPLFSPDNDTWAHVAIVRDDDATMPLRFYVDGLLRAWSTDVDAVDDIVSATGGFSIGALGNDLGTYYLQQIRLSIGSNRGYVDYSFDIPSEPFNVADPITGTGAIDIPQVVAAGFGEGGAADPVNIGEVAIPLVMVEGRGSTGGSGSTMVPMVRVSGTGGNHGLISIPKAVVSGSGNVEITGTGQVIAPSIQVSGAGGNRGQAVIPMVQVAGSGLAALSGTGAVRIPTVQVAGSGVIEGKGIGSVFIPAIRVEGTGSHGIIGSGMVAVPTVRCNGRGAIASWQQVSAKVPRIIVRGIGTILERETNTGLINIPPATVFGRGDVEPAAETILQFMRP